MDEKRLRVIAYDIVRDRSRAKMQRLAAGFADRVQDSVFEGWLTEKETDTLLRHAAKIVDARTDSVRIYTLCEACRPRIRLIGGSRPEARDTVIV